jgi:NADH-quinone oxidoreductase subunit A
MLGIANDTMLAAVPVAQAVSPYRNTNLELVIGMMLFVAAGFAMVFAGLMIGKFARPALPHPEKGAAYECGEPAIGDSWVQFDLRFYTVALVFIVFDVEVALLWPWAVTFKEMGAPAFWAFLVFFLLIAIPFLYEWKSGYLDWVRASTGQRRISVLEGRTVEATGKGAYAASAETAGGSEA